MSWLYFLSSFVASLGFSGCLLIIIIYGYYYCYLLCACHELLGLEGLAIGLFLMKDLFDLTVARCGGTGDFGDTQGSAGRPGRPEIEAEKVTDTHADQRGCREILRVGGTGLCTLVTSQEGTEW